MQISSISAFSAGLSSIQAGQQRAHEAASEIAGLNAAPEAPAAAPDLTSLLLSLDQGRQAVEAGARVVQSADDTLGTLIDTRA